MYINNCFKFPFHVPRAKQRDCEDCEEAINLLNGDSVHGSMKEDGRMCSEWRKSQKGKIINRC